MVEIIQTWDEVAQQLFLWASLLAAFFAAWIAIRNIRIVLRGYPPVSPEDVAHRAECENDESLAGYCIKRGGNCKTKDECQAIIDRHNSVAREE